MDIIKIENEGYALYEELLLRRDKLRKEAHILQGLYMKEFGDSITAVFEKKIACIRKKKIIAFCQAAKNKGDSIDQAALQAHIRDEMAEYQRQLEQMIQENDAAHNMITVSAGTVAKIKKLYRKLAKILHPDINPKTNEIPALLTLWNIVVTAYHSNSLEELQEAEALVNRALREYDLANLTVEIPDLDEKIAKVEEEIQKIKTTIPYRYKHLLADETCVQETHDALDAELQEYETYEKELDEVLTQLLGSGVSIVWRMK